MTPEQAAQYLAQQQQQIALLNTVVHDIFPFVAVLAALWLGVVLGRLAVGA